MIGETASTLLLRRPAVAAIGADRNGCRSEPIRDVGPDDPSRLVDRVVIAHRQQQARTHAIAHALGRRRRRAEQHRADEGRADPLHMSSLMEDNFHATHGSLRALRELRRQRFTLVGGAIASLSAGSASRAPSTLATALNVTFPSCVSASVNV